MKRARRIAKRCVPEVVEAVGRGYLSPSSADKIWRSLPEREQHERIKRLIERKDRDRSRCRLVVEILRAHLDSGTRDLHDLKRDLFKAFCEGAGEAG